MILNFTWVLRAFVVIYQAFIARIEFAPIEWATPVFEVYSLEMHSAYVLATSGKRK